MIERLFGKSQFSKYVLVLTSGTIIAQAIAYLLSPVITRLYTPEEMAELSLFVTIVGIGTALATAKYELALPIVKSNKDAFRLYQFSRKLVWIVCVCALVGFLPFVFISDSISYAIFYALIPAGILFLSTVQLGTYWAIRFKSYRLISTSRVLNAVISNGGKVGLGFLQLGFIGLILAFLAGILVSAFLFFIDFSKSKNKHRVGINAKRNVLVAKKYSDFPKINLPHGMMDLMRDLLVLLLVWHFFSQRDYGLYSHAFQMLKVPLILIGAAIGQVFFQRCSELHNTGKDILPVALKSIRSLLLLSIVPFAIVFFFGEELFAFVFGEEWREAGEFAEIMSPWFMVNFISSPISTIPLVLRRQKSFFFLALFGAVLLLLSIFIPAYFFKLSITTTLWIVSASQFFYSILVIVQLLKYAKSDV